MSDVSAKQTAERTQAFKSHLETNVGHGQFVRSQQFFGPFDPFPRQVLMGRLIESLSEQSEEMVAGETGFAGNLIEAERMAVVVVYKRPRAAEPLVDFLVGRRPVIVCHSVFVQYAYSRTFVQ
jgi:hypothetical protein